MPTLKAFANIPPFPADVPTLQLSKISLAKLMKGDQAESEAVFRASKAHGFFLLDMQHSVKGEELLEQAERIFGLSKDLFEEGVEELTKFVQPPPAILGYHVLGSAKIETGAPDRFEWYTLSQDDILGTASPQSNPRTIEDNRSFLASYIQNSHSIISILLSHLDRHLKLPPETLGSRQRLAKPSGTCLRLIKYPPQPSNDRRTSLFGHTDVETVTLLFNVLGGLQILPHSLSNEEGNWQYIKPQPGCAIINLGDTSNQWTGGILRSNLHRVVSAPGKQGDVTRYSVAYLVRPEGKASMRRLAVEGSLIPKAGDGEDIDLTAEEWAKEKTRLAHMGTDLARNKEAKA